ISFAAGTPLSSAVTSLNGATRSGTSLVGSLAPNSLGLYDTRGNVMEFCMNDEAKHFWFLKGGSWADFVEVNLRPDFRWYCKPDDRKNTFGFRCVLKKG
ncbi:MAG TPA: SUMF1/EgtB/PvdO family nonheme iron enzyme, partial [Verrucomicrobiae bacterium]|nr:SUMF1/EgtB/PvdO family nonheme iron enzyme [Verrucomicrobiae bacterium]